MVVLCETSVYMQLSDILCILFFRCFGFSNKNNGVYMSLVHLNLTVQSAIEVFDYSVVFFPLATITAFQPQTCVYSDNAHNNA